MNSELISMGLIPRSFASAFFRLTPAFGRPSPRCGEGTGGETFGKDTSQLAAG